MVTSESQIAAVTKEQDDKKRAFSVFPHLRIRAAQLGHQTQRTWIWCNNCRMKTLHGDRQEVSQGMRL